MRAWSDTAIESAKSRLTTKSVVGPVPDRAPHLTPCRLYVGSLSTDGYGQITIAGKRTLAHRAAWELHQGRDIRPGYEIDHLCFVRNCVNPEHLDECTRAENNQRAHMKDRCPCGHEYDIRRLGRNGYVNRWCSACQAAYAAANIERKTAVSAAYRAANRDEINAKKRARRAAAKGLAA